MIKQLFVIETADTDPYHNLGLEKYLFDRVPANACILYIWQNDRTVVIGRNQLAENECNINDESKTQLTQYIDKINDNNVKKSIDLIIKFEYEYKNK